MKRSVLAVLAGAGVWSLFYQPTFPILRAISPEVWGSTRVDDPTWLSVLIVLTFGYSVLAGYVTGLVARTREVAHAAALGSLQLTLGIIFEVMFWEATPAWYHLTFLALLLPGNLSGGWLRKNRVIAPRRPVAGAA